MEEGRLPLLQFALKETWERRAGDKLTAEAYAAVGGVAGAIEKTAQSAFEKLTPKQQEAARRLFLRLVTPGEGREDTRARSVMPDDPLQLEIVNQFANPKTRLLVTGFTNLQRTAQEASVARATVEVAHEALIRRWETLRKWVNEDRERLRARAAILRAKAEWEEKAQSADYLLDRGVQLERGRALLKEPGAVPVEDIRRYVDLSIAKEKSVLDAEREADRADQQRIADAERQAREAAEEAERQAKARAEAERQAREAADEAARQAKARAEAEGQAREAADEAARQAGARAEAERQAREAAEGIAEEQKKAVVAGRRTAQVAVVGLVVAVLVAAVAVWQYFAADQATREALAQRTEAQRQREAAVQQKDAADQAKAQAQVSADEARANLREAEIAREAADQAKKDALTQREVAVQQKDAADRAKAQAQANAEQANANLRQAQITQSRFLVDQAQQEREAGGAGSAVLLALEALPDAATGKAWPYDPEAESLLDGALRDLRERLIIGHDDIVSGAAFSPDGKRIVTASLDKTARVWDAATGQPIGEPLKGHEDLVYSAAFSPDGKRIVTASWDKTARVWDTGQPIGEPLRGHEGRVYSAAFSPDGKRVVTASLDKTARVWDAATGQPIGEPLKGHDGFVWRAAFSPDGKRIVTASWDKTARVWDAATGKPIGEPLKGHEGSLLSAAFSPDGKRIVTASSDKTARVCGTPDRDGRRVRPRRRPLRSDPDRRHHRPSGISRRGDGARGALPDDLAPPRPPRREIRGRRRRPDHDPAVRVRGGVSPPDRRRAHARGAS